MCISVVVHYKCRNEILISKLFCKNNFVPQKKPTDRRVKSAFLGNFNVGILRRRKNRLTKRTFRNRMTKNDKKREQDACAGDRFEKQRQRRNALPLFFSMLIFTR